MGGYNGTSNRRVYFQGNSNLERDLLNLIRLVNLIRVEFSSLCRETGTDYWILKIDKHDLFYENR